MSLQAIPGPALTPSSSKVPLKENYINNFDFLNQYLPDTYEKEFERYGNRTISAFLRMVGAELPTNSDLIKWAEQGRLHTKFVGCETQQAAGAIATPVTWLTGGAAAGTNPVCNFRVGQTVFISEDGGANSNKGLITSVGVGSDDEFTVAYYEADQAVPATTGCSVFVYGSEFRKGTDGMIGSLESEDIFLENKPIIIKDKYAVNGSDMAQIGWVEVSTEDGATGYLWYLKSEHETRLRFDDYLEMAMIEGVAAEAGSGALAALSPNSLTPPASNSTDAGTEGMFEAISTRGNVYSGVPANLGDWDTIIERLDKQGAIQENVVFVNRDMSFAIDDMLAAQNSYGQGGTSYGLFDNDEEMALNLGFTGFRRGYDFYKSDWKYLNDPTMRGGLPTGAGSV